MKNACPCYSGKSYKECCQPFHDGQTAPDAECLMRSRYSAYALRLPEYILQTWHPETRPAELSTASLGGIKWLKLQVLSFEQVDVETAFVKFLATFQSGKAKKEQLTEHSRFRLENGHWLYVDGQPD